jgi:hypothetical protein
MWYQLRIPKIKKYFSNKKQERLENTGYFM